jgi:hypothetical protein
MFLSEYLDDENMESHKKGRLFHTLVIRYDQTPLSSKGLILDFYFFWYFRRT